MNRNQSETDSPGPGRVAILQDAGLYILMGALLLGVLWTGGYFPVPKWYFAAALLLAGSWELVTAVAFGGRRILRSPLLWILAAFTAYAAATFAWTEASARTNQESVLLLGYLSAFFVARSQMVRSGQRAASMLLNWLVYTAAFASAWGIITYLLRIYPYVTLVDGFLRAGSTFEYSNALSCFVLMALPVSLALFQDGAPGERPVFATAAMLQTAAVILSFSRLGLVALGGVLLYFAFTSRRRGSLPQYALCLVAGFLTAAAAMVLGEAEYGKTGVVAVVAIGALSFLGQSFAATKRGRSVLKRAFLFIVAAGVAGAGVLVITSPRARLIITRRFGEGFALDRLLPHRQDTWQAAWDAFKDRPARGWGLGAFSEIFVRYQSAHFTKFAHNVVLQMAVETGIAGAALFALFLGWATVLSAWRLIAGAALVARALAIAVLVFIFYNMFDWEWYIPAITGWLVVALAILEYQNKSNIKGQKS